MTTLTRTILALIRRSTTAEVARRPAPQETAMVCKREHACTVAGQLELADPVLWAREDAAQTIAEFVLDATAYDPTRHSDQSWTVAKLVGHRRAESLSLGEAANMAQGLPRLGHPMQNRRIRYPP